MQRAKRGPGRPPKSTSEATRANILRAARACFSERGFAVTTNRDIAERAGITAAAIYQYFQSKAALYAATAHETTAIVAAHMQTLPPASSSGASVLSSIVLSLLQHHKKDPSLGPFLVAVPGELRRHPELAQLFNPVDTAVAKILNRAIAQAVEQGEVVETDAPRVGEMFVACMLGLAQYAAAFGRADNVAITFAELLDGRLFTRPATPRSRRKKAAKSRAKR